MITFVFIGFCCFLRLKILKLNLFFFFGRMMRGQEETSTSQARRRRGTP